MLESRVSKINSALQTVVHSLTDVIWSTAVCSAQGGCMATAGQGGQLPCCSILASSAV